MRDRLTPTILYHGLLIRLKPDLSQPEVNRNADMEDGMVNGRSALAFTTMYVFNNEDSASRLVRQSVLQLDGAPLVHTCKTT